MNQINNLQVESQQQTLIWSKKAFKIEKKEVQDCVLNNLNEGNNYNPMKHWKQVYNYWFKDVGYI